MFCLPKTAWPPTCADQCINNPTSFNREPRSDGGLQTSRPLGWTKGVRNRWADTHLLMVAGYFSTLRPGKSDRSHVVL